MRRLASELEIDAPPERVWEQLTDFAGFPSWNPLLRRASGELEVGNQLQIRIKLGRSERDIKPRLSKLETNRELRWLVHVGPKGLFDVERTFRCEPLSAGRTRFAQSEICTGLFEPILFIGGKLERDILRGHQELAQAIKQRVEKKPARA